MKPVKSVLAMAVAATCVFGQAPKSADLHHAARLTNDERAFVQDVLEGGKAEVSAAKLAMKKTTNPQVKAFAQMLERDHTKANAKLSKIAQANGITLSTSETSAAKSGVAGELFSVNGGMFDKLYVDLQVQNHEKTIAKFEGISKTDQNAELREFAQATLPALHQHLDQAKALAAQVGK